MGTAAQSSRPEILTQLTTHLDVSAGKAATEIANFRLSTDYHLIFTEANRDNIFGYSHETFQFNIDQTQIDSTSDAFSRVEEVGDWMATLDIINAVVGHTEEHMRHQNEQNLSYQAELDGLRRDLGQVKECLQAAEMRAHQAQVHADIRLQRAQAEANSQIQIIRAESEARVRTIRAVMDAQMREAEERVRIADLRASTAEQWLQRIDVAAKELLLRVI